MNIACEVRALKSINREISELSEVKEFIYKYLQELRELCWEVNTSNEILIHPRPNLNSHKNLTNEEVSNIIGIKKWTRRKQDSFLEDVTKYDWFSKLDNIVVCIRGAEVIEHKQPEDNGIVLV